MEVEEDGEVEFEFIEGSGEIWTDKDDFEKRILKDSAYFMNQSQLKNQNATVLVGWAVLFGIIMLVVLICSNYFIWKSRRRSRNAHHRGLRGLSSNIKHHSETDNPLQSTKPLDLVDIDVITTVRQQSISLPAIPLTIESTSSSD